MSGFSRSSPYAKAQASRSITSRLRRATVPESKGRAKASYTPPQHKSKAPVGNPSWFVPVMVGLFILGLLWIVTFYVTQGAYPIPALHVWNLAVGFALLMAGFAMTTRWR
jgi:hypothetical protein